MKIVGLTGGIGSGKTTVAQIFEELGVPVYNSDHWAKRIMRSSKVAKRKIVALLGNESYGNGQLNKTFIAEKVFKDPKLLLQLNKIVHPLVRKSFRAWTQRQNHSFVIQEAAIIFEMGNQERYDYIILVTAPKEVRLARVMERDDMDQKEVLERMANQWPDSEKIPLSDFVISNLTLDKTASQVREVYGRILDNS